MQDKFFASFVEEKKKKKEREEKSVKGAFGTCYPSNREVIFKGV